MTLVQLKSGVSKLNFLFFNRLAFLILLSSLILLVSLGLNISSSIIDKSFFFLNLLVFFFYIIYCCGLPYNYPKWDLNILLSWFNFKSGVEVFLMDFLGLLLYKFDCKEPSRWVILSLGLFSPSLMSRYASF